MTSGARLGPPVAAARHNNLTGWLRGGRVLLLTNIVRIERLPGATPPLGTAAAHAAPLRRGEYPRAPLECTGQSARGGGRRGAWPRGSGKSGEAGGVTEAVRGRALVGQCGSSRCEGRVVSRRASPSLPRGATDTCRPLPRCQVISHTYPQTSAHNTFHISGQRHFANPCSSARLRCLESERVRASETLKRGRRACGEPELHAAATRSRLPSPPPPRNSSHSHPECKSRNKYSAAGH